MQIRFQPIQAAVSLNYSEIMRKKPKRTTYRIPYFRLNLNTEATLYLKELISLTAAAQENGTHKLAGIEPELRLTPRGE